MTRPDDRETDPKRDQDKTKDSKKARTDKNRLDKPSETAKDGLPGAGEGASARHYTRDLDPKAE